MRIAAVHCGRGSVVQPPNRFEQLAIEISEEFSASVTKPLMPSCRDAAKTV